MNMHFHLFVGQKAGIATCAYVWRRLVRGWGGGSEEKMKMITGRGIKKPHPPTCLPITITHLVYKNDQKIKRKYEYMHIHVIHFDK